MHREEYEFVRNVKISYPNNFKKVRVLEVGSLNVNGTIRVLFENCEYIGIDIGPGPCVDFVCEGQKFPGEDNYYDTVISCECFEHNPQWLATFFNMWRVCKPNGLVIFTCATTGRPPHGLSTEQPAASPLTVNKGWNYYKNLTQVDFRIPLNFDYFFSKYQFSTVGHDLYFYGQKRIID